MSSVLPFLIQNTHNILLMKGDIGRAKPSIMDLPDRSFQYGKRVHRDGIGMKELTSDWQYGYTNSPKKSKTSNNLPDESFTYGQKNKYTFNTIWESHKLEICERCLRFIRKYLQNEKLTSAKKTYNQQESFVFTSFRTQFKNLDVATQRIQDEEILRNQIQNILIMISILRNQQLCYISRFFKTSLIEQPKMKKRSITPIYPPPGLNLAIPDWPVEQFMLRIGFGCSEYADKFEKLTEVFDADRFLMKEKGIPPKVRKYLFSIKEQLRRGVLTFEYLERRTSVTIPKKKITRK